MMSPGLGQSVFVVVEVTLHSHSASLHPEISRSGMSLG